MCRPNFSLLPIHDAFQQLTRWLEPQMPAKLLHDHEKISDAQLVALALLQRVHKAVYFRHWWRFLKLNHFAWFPSETQARIRLARLTPLIERLSVEVQKLDFVVIDSGPLPMSTFKRAPRCKFPGAAHGFGTSGPVYGFKLYAWTTLNGKIAKYEIHPANLHEFTALCIVNRDWPAHGRSGVLMRSSVVIGAVLTKTGVRSRRQGQSRLGIKAISRGCTSLLRRTTPSKSIRAGRKNTRLHVRLSNQRFQCLLGRAYSGVKSKPC